MFWRNHSDERSDAGLFGFTLGFVGALVFALLLMTVGGFLSFVDLVSRTQPMVGPADGIVVLTGGGDRLDGGMDLLTKGYGKKLLLSGVNRTVVREDVRKLVDAKHQAMFDCCVELDFAAKNTIGNASETARWAEQQGYQRLILVTANYHMPRALAELHQVAPDLEVIPHPISPEDLHVRDWWRWPGSARLLAAEYLKFLATQFRFRLQSLIS